MSLGSALAFPVETELPLKSMTGYGKGQTSHNGRQVTIEVKAVNHRFLDLNLKLPKGFLFLDDLIRKTLAKVVSRGHLDVYVTYDNQSEDKGSYVCNNQLGKDFYFLGELLSREIGIENDLTISSIMKAPDVLERVMPEENEEELKNLVVLSLASAMTALEEMRIAEGAEIKKDLASKLDALKKMRDEIIPSIMKSSSMTEPIKDISEINIEDFTELNPQWKDSIEKIKDQIKELDMLRQEGADTNMCTFSQLKRYPFFYEPSHWFCIFGPEIPEIYEMYTDTQNNYASFINTLENATDMCNSDKFSLCLTFKTMPSLPVDALNSGLSAQNQILKEQEGTESEKNIRRMESRHFIQDMYRFCKLWGTKNDKIDIFNENMKIWENRQIHDLLEEDEKIKPLADYLFAKGYTTAALLLYLEIIIEDPTNVEAFQKIGYGHILNENYESAIRALETANILDSGNEWTLKNLALCYRKKGNYIKALEYLKEAEKANPDSINICNQIGQIYIMNDRYDDALKYMFKVEYLTKGRTSAQRAIAWCYFMTGRYEEAIKIYEKVIEKPDATAEDWMNMGHVYMVNNDITSGIRFYKKANELSNGKLSFYDMFSKDTEMLSSKGVSEEIIWMIPDMVAMNN